MRGIPENLDLSPFLNEEIEAVSLGQYMFTLVFGKDDLSISCYGDVIVERNGVPVTIRRLDNWVDINPLTEIQNSPVTKFKVESKISFSLTLQNGVKIFFTDSTTMYESFEIQMEGKLIIF